MQKMRLLVWTWGHVLQADRILILYGTEENGLEIVECYIICMLGEHRPRGRGHDPSTP